MILFLAWLGMMTIAIAIAILSTGEGFRIGPFEIGYVGLPEPKAQRLLAFADNLRLRQNNESEVSGESHGSL